MPTHPDTIMGKKKPNFGKRFSQFLTKIFWHFNQQPTPIYSCVKQKSLTPSSKRSIKKHQSKSYYQKSSIDRYYIRSQYPACYRTCSIRDRSLTLSSIPEE